MTYPASTTPDVTLSSAAAVQSQLSAWNSNWAGTVPDGKTADDERMIGVDTSLSTVITATNLTFPQKVWIRPVGTFTDYDCSVKFTGGINKTGSTNLWLFRCHIIGSEKLVINQTQSCGANRCFLQGVDVATPEGYPFPNFGYVVDIENGLDDYEFEHCNIGWHSILLYTHSGAVDGLAIESCVFDWASHDSIHNTANRTNYTSRRNWYSRRYSIGEAYTGKHEDGEQQSGGSTNNALHWGNVLMRKDAFWYGGSTGSNQGIFYGDGFAGTNVEVTQNIICTNSNGIKWGEDGGVPSDDAGSSATYNTLITIPGQYHTGIATADGDLVTAHNFCVANGNDYSQTGGIGIDLGSSITPTYTTADTYFASRCPREGDDVGYLEPETGLGIHWNDAGQKTGAYLRLQEIFETGGLYVPGNVGWPVAAPWTDQFNADGLITTTYVPDAYDADGENTGTLTPTAPSITGVPTISGTENVGQILTASAAPASGYPVPTTTWQWYNSVSGAISGATSSTYTLTSEDEGDVVYVVQTETNTTDPFTDTAQSANSGTIGAALSAPTVSAFFPLDNATGVPVDTTFTVTFNQNVQFGTGTISLWRAGQARETWNVATNVGTGPHTVSISGAVLTIDTFSDMLLADYSIHIDNGAIESLTGAAFPGFSDDTTWNFSTTASAPAGVVLSIGGTVLHLGGVPLIITG